MTDTDIFRNRVGDRIKSTTLNASGNGVDKQFDLQYQNISDYTVVVDGTTLNDVTDFQVDRTAGLIMFTTAPVDGADIQLVFSYSAFSDDDIADLLATFGRSGAILEGIKMLLADAARLYNYTKGMNQSQRQGVFQNLQALYDTYMKHGVDGSANSVAIGRRRVGTSGNARMRRDFNDGWLGR